MPTRAKALHILIVDDEPLIRDTLTEYLTQEGFPVTSCGSGEDALALARDRFFDVILCDVQLPGIDGIEFLERLLKVSPQTFVLLITAYGTVENAVEAFHRGAHDYLMKPILLEEVHNKIRRLLAYRDVYLENQWLRRELNRNQGAENIIGKSPP
ncbi:MAG TPA: response regulator, partial [Gemmataceae bacterium]|nr:response regulator [Gemmataceae bacterium]